MDLQKLNTQIEGNNFYQFLQRHKKVITIIQGMFIIGLLIAMNMYVVKDHFIKKQIKENCGYTTSTYRCICDKEYVDNWEALERGDMSSLNLSNIEDDPTDR